MLNSLSFAWKMTSSHARANRVRFFFQRFTSMQLNTRRSQKNKKTLMTWLSFLHNLDLRRLKLHVKHWWNWPQECPNGLMRHWEIIWQLQNCLLRLTALWTSPMAGWERQLCWPPRTADLRFWNISFQKMETSSHGKSLSKPPFIWPLWTQWLSMER